jgi:hypothetical protein
MKSREITDKEFLTHSDSRLSRIHGISRERVRQVRKKRRLANPLKNNLNKAARLSSVSPDKSIGDYAKEWGISRSATLIYLRRNKMPYRIESTSSNKGKVASNRKYPYHEVDFNTITVKELSEKWGVMTSHARVIISRVRKGTTYVDREQG